MKLSHDPLQIPEALAYLDKIIPTLTVNGIASITHETLDHVWRHWLSNSIYNTVIGLDTFKYSCFASGTTPVFGEFIARYNIRRIRVSRSDFVLTQILSQTYNRKIQYLEDEKLDANDCVILSFPFSGNGSYYPDYLTLLDRADILGIPVFVDGAYFGISHGIDYPLNRKCVTDFATSLSKNLAGAPFRMGIRFTRYPVDDTISAGLIGSDLFDRLNASLSIQLLKQFSHNWIIEKYRPVSDQICFTNNLAPTNTVTIGLDNNCRDEFKRGDYYRVCISEELNRVS